MEEDSRFDRELAPLQGLALVVFASSAVFGTISIVVVCLRVYVRWHEGSIWWDDGLMFGSMLLYVADVGIACASTFYGVGTRDEHTHELLRLEGNKLLMMWTILYSACLASVKSSICMTLLRLSRTMRTLRLAIYVLMGLSIATFVAVFICSLTLCRPIEASWDIRMLRNGTGTCAPPISVQGIVYTTAATALITDAACAAIPAIILWKIQIDLRTKILASVLLSFGSCASICTVIRTPYTRYYAQIEDHLYWTAHVMMWSNIETAVGLIAGSLPVLQRLIMQRRAAAAGATDEDGAAASGPAPGGGGESNGRDGLVTFGSLPSGNPGAGGRGAERARRHQPRLPTASSEALRASVWSAASARASRGCEGWEEDDDDESEEREEAEEQGGEGFGAASGADHTYEVELSEGAVRWYGEAGV
ncbi:hypothetical protein GGS23DRAFT_620677 [Durotheca rogersii]|uniref:uncharacterized protein n=1 Tax=Durotheca rogersii TaxID=419775 RepID=UPI00222095AA|nr:uncharacterized protein GGS23DRAFT_620677 [Durotheca rogersii]KAI5863843.1 hypothetical protein GGS23DRAFT_620677 [Durotheca rogersii]